MGISVSVDSWLQQTLEELCQTRYPPSNPIYSRLLTSASCPSEIFILESSYFASLVRSSGDNLINSMAACLEGLVSNECPIRLNSAALLSRIFPFLCSSNTPLSLEEFLLSQTSVLALENTSPGAHIVESSLKLFLSFSLTDLTIFLDSVERNLPVIDFLALSVFSCLLYCHNLTLFHQMAIFTQAHADEMAQLLFNYVHIGGRSESVISILTLLMLHPNEPLTSYQKSFVKAGGQLSTQLCETTGDVSDLLCYLCALTLREDDAIPSLSARDPNLLRLGLVKLLMNSEIRVTPKSVVSAFEKTQSPLARAIMGRLESPSEICPPMKDYVVVNPHSSLPWMKRIGEIVAKTFLFIKGFWFKGTDVEQSLPDFTAFDELVSEAKQPTE